MSESKPLILSVILNTHCERKKTENTNCTDKEPETAEIDIKAVFQAIINISETLKNVDVRLTNIEQKSDTPFQIADLNPVELPLPATNIQKLEQLEELITNNEDYKKKYFHVLRLTGGTNEKHCINKCLEKLFTNYCAMFCSWTGKKDNFKIKDMKLMEVLKLAVRSNFPNLLDEHFEKCVMQWMQFAKVRHDRGKI